MASHFSDIGFRTSSHDEVLQLAIRAAESGVRHTTSLGDYILWSLEEKIELWVHVSGNDEITQIHPHYAGSSRMMCSITDLIIDPEYPLEGSISGWACVTREHPEIGDFPLTAKIPDFIRHFQDAVLPIITPLQVTAFAQQVIYFPDDNAFNTFQITSQKGPRFNLLPPNAAPKSVRPWFGWRKGIVDWLSKPLKSYQAFSRKRTGSDIVNDGVLDESLVFADGRKQDVEFRMAAESFVPIGGPNGFFTENETCMKPDAESVLMSGHIITCQLHTNPQTGLKFFAMTLRIQQGIIDVVADAQLFEEMHLLTGGILQGSFWLSAHLIEDCS